MSHLCIVCQTIIFGENQRERFPEIFRALADAGYDGVEIGWRHIAGLDPAALRRELDSCGLRLVASHAGGNLEDLAQAAGERRTLDVVVDFLNRAGAGLLMYSGLRWESAEQFAKDVDMLSRGARRCAESGIQLLYHNHAWEFEAGERVMNGLLERADAKLGLCPDLGWIHKGGGDVLGFLKKNNARLGAIHFKDFATMDPVVDTVVLGRGIAPLRQAAAWLKQSRPDLCLIAEQDKCDGAPADAAAANAAFLKEAWV